MLITIEPEDLFDIQKFSKLIKYYEYVHGFKDSSTVQEIIKIRKLVFCKQNNIM